MIFCLQKISKDHEEIHLWFHQHEINLMVVFSARKQIVNCFYISLVFCCPSVYQIFGISILIFTLI